MTLIIVRTSSIFPDLVSCTDISTSHRYELWISNGLRASEEELLDVILRNAKRLQRLADDILDATKIERRSLILNKERLNLNDVISNGIQDIKNQIDYTSSGVKVMNGTKADEVIFLEADKYRVTQVVTNLLSNAVKFLKGYDGTISVNLEKKEDVEGRHESISVCYM